MNLVVRHVFDASAEFLFDAWTDPHLMTRWFYAREAWTADVIRADARVGGAWEIVMRHAGVPQCRVFGHYREIDRPRRLVFTWFVNERQDYETTVTLVFNPLGPDRTEIVLTHEGLRSDTDRVEHRDGWDGCLASLARLVTTRRGQLERT